MATAAVRWSLVAVGLAWALVAQVVLAADARTYVLAGSKAATLASCVEPTDVMRRQHMQFIKHQRDETVHSGIRSSKHSLAGCVDCHVREEVSAGLVPIHHREEFCGACHAYTAVNMNCFDCHASVPNGPGAELAARAAHQAAGVHVTGEARPDGENH
ncbi:MAG: sulfur reduction protein DsrJ [Sphingobacteriia bacterium]|nr:sulfur reduction protein DsrJ [Sphingobacteriia bacterium]NCC37818.1 sulfur reduction protein DsrJ [Gammaproteobacteria bacterium]